MSLPTMAASYILVCVFRLCCLRCSDCADWLSCRPAADVSRHSILARSLAHGPKFVKVRADHQKGSIGPDGRDHCQHKMLLCNRSEARTPGAVHPGLGGRFPARSTPRGTGSCSMTNECV